MKELYISPELEILSFLPVEGVASDWDGRNAVDGNRAGDNLSTRESRPGDYEETYGD